MAVGSFNESSLRVSSDSTENHIYSNQITASMVTESKDKNHDHMTMIEERITKDNHDNNDLTTNANKFKDKARGSHDKLGSYKYAAIEPVSRS
jgi:hypothetical protein